MADRQPLGRDEVVQEIPFQRTRYPLREGWRGQQGLSRLQGRRSLRQSAYLRDPRRLPIGSELRKVSRHASFQDSGPHEKQEKARDRMEGRLSSQKRQPIAGPWPT